MKIQQLTIRNILGVTDLNIEPGAFTTIEGPNGTGKTSVLEAIKAAGQPGHDATLLHRGAEDGEIVFVLDNGMSISKAVTADTSSTTVRGADGKKIARPAETIARLMDAMSVNPVKFLNADKKDRVRVLLESMPLQVDAEHLTKISGVTVTASADTHALQVIELVHKQVFENRTGTNRAIKEKDATIKQLTDAMPAPIGGVDGSEDEIAEQVATATAARDTRLGQIATKLTGIEADTRSKIDGIRTKLQADIDALKAAAQTEVDAINAELTKQTGLANTARESAAAKHATVTAPLAAALVTIRNSREQAAKRETTVALIETMTGELEDLREEAALQTAALTAIEAYKSQLLADLPIPGLEVRGGEVYRNDVQFDRLNTAQQVDIAVDIAKLRAGELGVVCIDRVESLDTPMFDSFRDRLIASGLQAFVTRVGDSDDDSFEITTTNAQ